MLPNLPDDEASCRGTRDWPHAPPHRLAQAGVYFLTARTLDQIHHFAAPDRRTFLQECLFALSEKYGWTLEAWAVLANHYHFVAHSPESEDSAESLQRFIKHLHADTARTINRFDNAVGRQVWHSYRETHLTLQRGYLARLHYTHANAVHHGIVRVASEYEWCSAKRFKDACTPAWVKTVRSFRYDEIAFEDGDIKP